MEVVEQQDMSKDIELGSASNSNPQVAENEILDDRDGCWPDRFLLEDKGRDDYLAYGVRLYRAAMKGNVADADIVIDEHPNAVKQALTEGMETVLHIAVLEKQVHLATKLLVERIKDDKGLLRLKNRDGNTALSYAAITGKVQLAKLMVERDQSLPVIPNNKGQTPLHLAALLGRKDMVEYLYQLIDKRLTDPERAEIFFICIRSRLYGVANEMLSKNPELADARDKSSQETALHNEMLSKNPELADAGDNSSQETALHVLARKPEYSLFSVKDQSPRQIFRTIKYWMLAGCLACFCPLLCCLILCMAKIITEALKSLDDGIGHTPYLELVINLWNLVLQRNHGAKWIEVVENPTLLSLDAAKAGNVWFLVKVINRSPDLIWKVNAQNQTIFHYATMYRHESIFSLIHHIESMKEWIAAYKDEDDNNMLHLAARLPPPNRLETVSGAALQMHRELLWFKEVERVVPHSCSLQRNHTNECPPLCRKLKYYSHQCHGLTPWELFVKEHKELKKEGEEWMKRRAESLLVVPTLIAGAVFSSIFTVPGSAPDSGKPNFLNRSSFSVFVVSDAVALFSSLASILMLLSILTSRYTELDFNRRLPYLLLFGLVTLFVSIASMMVAFSASVFIIYYYGGFGVPLTIAILVSVPLALYASLNFPLFIDLWHATVGSRSLFRPRYKLIR